MVDKTPAIVYGSKGVNATGLIRSLGEAGYDVTFASSYSNIESKYTNDYLRLPEKKEAQIRALEEYILKLPAKPAVFTVDDVGNFLLDDHWELLSKIAYCPHASGRLRDISDKTYMADQALCCGLMVAPFVKLQICAGAEETCPIEFPVIIKPYAGYAGGKGDIRICRTLSEYFEAIEMLSRKNYSAAMVQKLIDKPDQFEIGLMGCSFPDGRVIIPCTIKKIRSYPTGRGSTSYAQIKNGYCGVDIDKVKAFVESTGYQGVFDVEMIVSGGDCFFLEINYRNGQYGYAPTAAGFNIPDTWIKGMTGQPVEEVKSIEEIFYINERDDFRHVIDGEIRFSEWLHEFHASKAFGMFCRGDQRPFLRQYIKIPDRIKIWAMKTCKKLKRYFC